MTAFGYISLTRRLPALPDFYVWILASHSLHGGLSRRGLNSMGVRTKFRFC